MPSDRSGKQDDDRFIILCNCKAYNHPCAHVLDNTEFNINIRTRQKYRAICFISRCALIVHSECNLFCRLHCRAQQPDTCKSTCLLIHRWPSKKRPRKPYFAFIFSSHSQLCYPLPYYPVSFHGLVHLYTISPNEGARTKERGKNGQD